MFYPNIATDNEAFGDEPEVEVARILRQIASRIEQGETDGRTRDSDGNMVGDWAMGR